MSIFIAMTDNFFSNWGQAENKTNTYVVECQKQVQANQIMQAASERHEMSRIRQLAAAPKSTNQVLVTLVQFADLGPIWTGSNT